MSAVEKQHMETPAEPRQASSRSRRKRPVRAATVSMHRLPKRVLELGRALYPEEEHADVSRPRTRGDCAEGIDERMSRSRPCPFVACKHHLYLDVTPRTGAIKFNFPDVEPDRLELLPATCSLDVATIGSPNPNVDTGTTLEGVAELMNLTRERVRQIEVVGLAKVRAAIEKRHAEFAALHEAGAEMARPSKRFLPVLHERDEAGDDFDAAEFASEALDAE